MSSLRKLVRATKIQRQMDEEREDEVATLQQNRIELRKAANKVRKIQGKPHQLVNIPKRPPTKGELWDKVTEIPRRDDYAIDPNFLWQTMEGEVLKAQQMKTMHLWNSLKMIWNHRVPVQYRIIPYRPYKGIEKWDAKRTEFAVKNLFSELMNRSDRTPFMEAKLREMAAHIAAAHREKIQIY